MDNTANQTETTQAVELVVDTRARDLVEGFKVRRALPSSRRRMVGPFIFLDQMGPAVLETGKGLDVAPHPHIGLATVTYLFKGELLHRDSLGMVQPIRPGEVNWMTAGRGIAHSERTPHQLRVSGSELYGIQSWVALPSEYEELDPSFAHHGDDELPIIEDEGKHVRVICGSLYGARSPVQTLSELFYADITLRKGARIQIPAEHEERAAFVVEGSIGISSDGGTYNVGQLVIFKPRVEIVIAGLSDSTRLMLLGGEPLGRRYIWWNFVSSSHDRIEQAKEDWREGRFAPIPQETDLIPLPETTRSNVKYP